jgi:hypothetical protein
MDDLLYPEFATSNRNYKKTWLFCMELSVQGLMEDSIMNLTLNPEP